MKKILVFALSVFCLNINAQKDKVYQNRWYNAEKDSPDNFSLFEKGKLYYAFSNNNDVICMDIKVDDPGVQTRILKEGLTIWIDMEDKQDKKMGIRFPIGSERYEGRKPINPLPARNPDGSLITPLSQANTIELIGFSGEDTRRIRADNTDSFRGSVKYDSNGSLCYKLIIPVEKLPIRNSKDGAGAMPFAFGLEYGIEPSMNAYNGSDAGSGSSGRSSGSRGGSGGGSRGGGGGGGSRGGGMSYGGGQGGPSQAQQSFKPPVIWWVKNIKLATDK